MLEDEPRNSFYLELHRLAVQRKVVMQMKTLLKIQKTRQVTQLTTLKLKEKLICDLTIQMAQKPDR